MTENLIMYLRKSRSDNPAETVEEVLAKHERILQDFCMREYGEPVPEPNIYREVVSGESIADRVEIRRVLSRIEHDGVAGIVVVEPQRLSRGDLVDCGTLINVLQYTHTPVITPVQTYRLENKMERRFFQDELMRGRDYLEYTKEILMRGKHPAIIDPETFEAVQRILSKRPPVAPTSALRNAFAGLLYCARCGRIMAYKDKGGIRRYVCCKTPGCSKSIKYDVLAGTVLQALRDSELPALEARMKDGNGMRELRKKQIAALEGNLRELRAREENQFDLLETKIYTREVFERRHAALDQKIRTTETKMLELRRSLPAAARYAEMIATLSDAIAALADPDVSIPAKNLLLKTIIERIDITSDPLQHYRIYDFDLKITLKL